jgi:hypothetical protein
MYWVNTENPSQFFWNPTYNTNDKQPYGAYVFDKLLNSYWKENYIHSYDNITDLYHRNETLNDKNLLILCSHFQITNSECNYLLDYLKQGGNALIAAEVFDSELEDMLYFFLKNNHSYFLPINLSLKQPVTSVHFYNSVSNDTVFEIPQSLVTQYFVLDTIPKADNVYVMAEDSENNPVMLHYKMGKGNLILSCTPLLFTNYAILSDSINLFITQSLAYLKNAPLVRTEYYEDYRYIDKNYSIFRYLLAQPSLKFAYFLVIITISIFMIFTAKRKQHPIPVLQPPPNKMLDFIRSISALYLIRNNNADLVLKKYIYWSDKLRKKYGIDIVNEEHDKTFIEHFSAKTGMSETEVRGLFLKLDGIRENSDINDKEMMDLITKMKI